MKKGTGSTLILGIIIGLLIAGGLLLWKNTPPTTEIAKVEQPKVSAPVQEKFTEIPVVHEKEKKESNPAEHYSYNLKYPEVTLTNDTTRTKEVNTAIATLVNDMIVDFKSGVKEAAMPHMDKNASSDFTMQFATELVTPTIISFRFDYSQYFDGAAHPNSQTKIFNYDIEERKILSTRDLFISKDAALPFLAQYSQDALRKSLTGISAQEFEDMVVPGTAPTDENFANVAIRTDGLLVIFNPYQVAPYARGTQEVTIPLSAMTNLIAPKISKAIGVGKANIINEIP